jgi:error-prone DNA polymerase
MVHPYLRRRNGEEEITYPHPALKPILERTLGVPLFQEQGMQVAIAAAGFTPAQADELRRAMGHKRSRQRMQAVSSALISGMIRNGISRDIAMRIYKQLTAFADYGFPESHAASFALLVYLSSYLKVYFPQEFYCALLNAQPMGFYSPATIIYEGQRRGIKFLNVDINRSQWDCIVEGEGVRLGFSYVKNLGNKAKTAITRERSAGPFASLRDFVLRTKLPQGALRQLALVGAFDCLGLSRRQALWQVLSLFERSQTELPIENTDHGRELLPAMAPLEFLLADFSGMDLSTRPHLMKSIRADLQRQGIKSAAELKQVAGGQKIMVAGVIIIRQRPQTAKGFVFITLEDETGFINIVVKPNLAGNCRRLISSSQALVVAGELEKREGVINVIGSRFAPLEFKQKHLRLKTRDFR